MYQLDVVSGLPVAMDEDLVLNLYENFLVKSDINASSIMTGNLFVVGPNISSKLWFHFFFLYYFLFSLVWFSEHLDTSRSTVLVSDSLDASHRLSGGAGFVSVAGS